MQKTGRRVPPRTEPARTADEWRAYIDANTITVSADVAREMDMQMAGHIYGLEHARLVVDGAPPNAHTLDVYAETHYRILCTFCGFEPPRPQYAYVYLLEAGGYYKIGVTRDVLSRIKQLQTGNPHPIKLRDCIIDDGARISEAELHRNLAHRQMAGEWFVLTPDEVDTVRGWFRNGIPTFLGGAS